MDKLEFYTFENEVWVRKADGTHSKFTDTDHELTKQLTEYIESFYSQAFKALQREYKQSSANPRYLLYRIAHRFCRCNFGQIDDLPDFLDGKFHFEHVACPLRGECRLENIVCNPTLDSKITDGEMRVLTLRYQGLSTPDIADKLCLSEYTVRNHIRNAMARTSCATIADLTKYLAENNIIKSEI